MPVVLVGQALDQINVRTMYWGSGAGVAIFALGWLLQEMGKRRS